MSMARRNKVVGSEEHTKREELEARKEDLRAISSQVREIGLRLNKELKQNR